MKTIFYVKFWQKDDGLLGIMSKTIEDLPFTPAIGMELEDPAWGGETRKIKRVVFSIDELYFLVDIEDYTLASEKEYEEQCKNRFKPLGWET
jgi:hypothetical protein